MTDLDRLNALVPGWTEGPGGMLCNPDPRGGIIDCTIKTEEWFFIRTDASSSEYFTTRAEAVEAFISELETKMTHYSVQCTKAGWLVKCNRSNLVVAHGFATREAAEDWADANLPAPGTRVEELDQ